MIKARQFVCWYTIPKAQATNQQRIEKNKIIDSFVVNK
jgi:hypothetical protein